jgi:hypothetical protein
LTLYRIGRESVLERGTQCLGMSGAVTLREFVGTSATLTGVPLRLAAAS